MGWGLAGNPNTKGHFTVWEAGRTKKERPTGWGLERKQDFCVPICLQAGVAVLRCRSAPLLAQVTGIAYLPGSAGSLGCRQTQMN